MAELGDDGAKRRGSHPLVDAHRIRLSRDEVEPGRAWNPKDWEEDQRYVEALEMVALGHKRDAVAKLMLLYADDPGHLYGRGELLRLAMELGIESLVREHAEWAVGFLVQQRLAQRACDAYRLTRLRFPALDWGERALVQVLVCGERCDDRRVVVDATKFLLAVHPASAALPKALLACANVQHAEGRTDLANQTLRHVLVKFPLDPLSEIARRRLQEIEVG